MSGPARRAGARCLLAWPEAPRLHQPPLPWHAVAPWFHIAAARSQETDKSACCTPWSAPLARGGRPNCPTPRARHAPPTEHFAKAAGGVIRHALHNLETLGLVEKNPGAKGGRRWAPRGEGSSGAAAAAQQHSHRGRGP